jgi:HAD superfamily hydrolase (TIGR01509 family)
MPERTDRPGDSVHPTPLVVLFDLDNTLFDHSYSARRALAVLRRSHPYLRRRTLTDIADEYQRLLDATHVHVMNGKETVQNARTLRIQQLLASSGAQVSREEAEALAGGYRRTYQEHRRAIPGSAALLRAVHKRAKVGIVTNNLVAEQEEKLRATGLAGSIDYLIISESAGFLKPDPRIFQLALDQAGCDPSEALMVGDSWTSDVRGALSAGIAPVWYNPRGLVPPEALEVRVISSYRPLKAALRVLFPHP